MAIEYVLYLNRRNILTPRNNDVFAAVLDLHVTIGILDCQVPRMKPAALEGFFSGFLIFEIALHCNIALEHNFAHRFPISRNWLHGFWIQHIDRLL